MQVGLVARKRALAAEESGIRHDVDGPLVDAFLAQLPFALTGDQEQRDRRDHATTWPAPAPMHRLLQGDVGSGKTVVALAALLVGGAGRLPGRVHGAHRGARRAALSRVGAAARRSDAWRPRARCSATGRCASSCSRTARPRPNGAGSRRPARGRGRHPRRHARAALRRRAVHQARPRRDRRAASLRRRAARAAQGEGKRRRRARRAGDDRHADPAHRGDARLRRPRQVGAARDAARPHADRDRGRRPEPARPGRACGSASAPRSRPATRRTSCARSWRTRARSRRRPRPPSTSGCRPRSCTALRLGLLHGQMPVEGEGSGDGGVPRRASSTCSSRRP